MNKKRLRKSCADLDFETEIIIHLWPEVSSMRCLSRLRCRSRRMKEQKNRNPNNRFNDDSGRNSQSHCQ